MGLAADYRRFIRNFSDLSKPLTTLTKKEHPFIWTDECRNAFNTLKKKLTTAPILAHPRMGVPFTLDTDASQYAISSVLSQEQDGKEQVTAYGSKTLSPAEQKYCATRKELLAIVYFLKYFRPYLYGQNVTVRTDHGAITWLLNFKNPEGQLARWLEVISQYQLKIVHRAGRTHSNADGLSRRPCSQCGRLQDTYAGVLYMPKTVRQPGIFTGPHSSSPPKIVDTSLSEMSVRMPREFRAEQAL